MPDHPRRRTLAEVLDHVTAARHARQRRDPSRSERAEEEGRHHLIEVRRRVGRGEAVTPRRCRCSRRHSRPTVRAATTAFAASTALLRQRRCKREHARPRTARPHTRLDAALLRVAPREVGLVPPQPERLERELLVPRVGRVQDERARERPAHHARLGVRPVARHVQRQQRHRLHARVARRPRRAARRVARLPSSRARTRTRRALALAPVPASAAATARSPSRRTSGGVASRATDRLQVLLECRLPRARQRAAPMRQQPRPLAEVPLGPLGTHLAARVATTATVTATTAIVTTAAAPLGGHVLPPAARKLRRLLARQRPQLLLWRRTPTLPRAIEAVGESARQSPFELGCRTHRRPHHAHLTRRAGAESKAPLPAGGNVLLLLGTVAVATIAAVRNGSVAVVTAADARFRLWAKQQRRREPGVPTTACVDHGAPRACHVGGRIGGRIGHAVVDRLPGGAPIPRDKSRTLRPATDAAATPAGDVPSGRRCPRRLDCRQAGLCFGESLAQRLPPLAIRPVEWPIPIDHVGCGDTRANHA